MPQSLICNLHQFRTFLNKHIAITKSNMKSSIYNISLWICSFFYILAGLNHFISTKVYYVIMPEWLPVHGFLIYLSGIIEIALGSLLLFNSTRRIAAVLIILMLIAFFPIHIYMIQIAPFTLGSIRVTALIAWLRIPFQLLFIAWAWMYIEKQNITP